LELYFQAVRLRPAALAVVLLCHYFLIHFAAGGLLLPGAVLILFPALTEFKVHQAW
jgi:hypothetical protein